MRRCFTHETAIHTTRDGSIALRARGSRVAWLRGLRGWLERRGFNTRVPVTWNRLWVLMWVYFSVGLLTAVFYVSFWTWLLLALLFFGVPEAIGIRARGDAFPPLTHVIRHFLPNYVAFPLIYGLFGAIAARWMEFPRPWPLGALLALLGWLTDHFQATYFDPDPGGVLTPQAMEAIDRSRETA
jgi:hypothetical protein